MGIHLLFDTGRLCGIMVKSYAFVIFILSLATNECVNTNDYRVLKRLFRTKPKRDTVSSFKLVPPSAEGGQGLCPLETYNFLKKIE